MAKKWISGAIEHPGGLHESLGVPKGKTIPKKEIEAAASRPGKVGAQARLAETLEGMHKKKRSAVKAKAVPKLSEPSQRRGFPPL